MAIDATAFGGRARALSAGAAGLAYGDVNALLVVFADGAWRWGLPPRGIPSDLAADRAAIPSRWGTLARSGMTLTLQRDGNVDMTFTENEGALTDAASGDAWTPIAELNDAGSLSGSYARPDWMDAAAPRLELRTDGGFAAVGRITAMCGSLHNVVDRGTVPPPDQWSDDAVFETGSGTWSAEGFTLRLDFGDGRVLQFALIVGSADQSIVLGETLLARTS